MKRMEVIQTVLKHTRPNDAIISTYSPTCHELFFAGDRETTFYIRDSMGMPTSVGLGLALSQPQRKVVVLDGDGALLMNLGSLATIATVAPKNLIIVLLDNEAYSNTGGQPTATGKRTDLEAVAKGAGIPNSSTARTKSEFDSSFHRSVRSEGPVFLVAKISLEHADVPLMTLQHIENKYRFLHALAGEPPGSPSVENEKSPRKFRTKRA
jgi:sulfopyruvate decarboxylase subunit beta